MPSPLPHGSSRRRRRTLSFHSQDTQDDTRSTSTPLSPPRSSLHVGSCDTRLLSSSMSSAGHREPIRSFIHGPIRDHLPPVDSVQSARSVREDTAELATYILSSAQNGQGPSFLSRPRSRSSQLGRDPSVVSDIDLEQEETRTDDTIAELAEPPSPEEPATGTTGGGGPSVIARMLRMSPPEDSGMVTPDVNYSHDIEECQHDDHQVAPVDGKQVSPAADDQTEERLETTPLLAQPRENSLGYMVVAADDSGSSQFDPESLKSSGYSTYHGRGGTLSSFIRTVRDPKCWDRSAIWHNAVAAPISCLPAVFVGVLLNILDALSYGMILFPLGNPIFANLGSAGISIFYVSTIVSQLTFSCGSIFKGGVGSELIEVVPFFHSMASTIQDIVGEEDPEAVVATTIVSYAVSSLLTGAVFYLMGKFRFGYIVGFIPRHILMGCIGGVGWFLVATGFEVTARMDGSFEYNMETLQKLFQSDTIPLWSVPLVLALVLFYGQTKIQSRYFLPLYIMAIPAVFYFFVLSLDALDTDNLRDHGWIFNGPPAGEPWWFFYTLYKFEKVHVGAILQCIPAMFALTFFGILHVPINVPALALQTGEDNANLDRELKLHGYSNFLSGCFGSIQNYLVYANTVLFMRTGGDSRMAGILLALLTAVVMVIGPSLIGFIPVMIVGCIIFDLGFELLIESVWEPRKKLKLLEWLTVLVIVLIMGIYDFVIGIGVGVVLALVSLVFQTSRVSAVRACYSGDVVVSTVRRNPTQQHYLKQVGRQIYILKLSGYLFFGTIVSVEETARALIADELFDKQPIKFLILDLWQVTGLDYSAGEKFKMISRLLNKKGIELILSGKDPESEVGRSLRAVGLDEQEGIEVKFLPDLNSALESCENELLMTLYTNQEVARAFQPPAVSQSLDVPGRNDSSQPGTDMLSSSPRRSHLQEAAQRSQVEVRRLSRWQNYQEPLRLMMQIFNESSPDKNEDFWFRAKPYFKRREHVAGTTLFHRNEPAEGFYLVEKGILRAEYDLPQGGLSESIVAGTTCGELPFFSDTPRTATCVVERDSVLWLMDREDWGKMQKEEPDVARELLRISLKLTSERMGVITAYILTMAG